MVQVPTYLMQLEIHIIQSMHIFTNILISQTDIHSNHAYIINVDGK